MRLFLVCTLLFASFILISGKYLSSETQELKYQRCYPPTDGFSIYNYSVTALNGQQVIRFEAFKEKALLFVNVATYCKCAQQQYTELNALKKFFGGEHFEIIAVPCNQFGKLEPSTKASEILNGLKYVRPGNGFEPNFILTERIDVNGDSGHMMYDFMKRSCPATR
ncbi:glutathione peroxidase-like protein 1, partial [Leptotrombidium deliense]